MESYRVPLTTRGFKIPCDGEQACYEAPDCVFLPVEVSAARWTLDTVSARCPVSERLGMPLRMWKYPGSNYEVNPPGWKGKYPAAHNRYATLLTLAIFPDLMSWGTPSNDMIEPGSVFVRRADGKDLDQDELQQICRYLADELQPEVKDTWKKISFGPGKSFEETFELQRKLCESITWDNVWYYEDLQRSAADREEYDRLVRRGYGDKPLDARMDVLMISS